MDRLPLLAYDLSCHPLAYGLSCHLLAYDLSCHLLAYDVSCHPLVYDLSCHPLAYDLSPRLDMRLQASSAASLAASADHPAASGSHRRTISATFQPSPAAVSEVPPGLHRALTPPTVGPIYTPLHSFHGYVSNFLCLGVKQTLLALALV